jgi:RimJ/RimL family protein N-acetyltransferase
MKIESVTLTGSYVRLEPLSEAHTSGLAQVALDEKIWRYMLYGPIRNETDLHGWVLDILRRQAAGNDLPFAVTLKESGQPVGGTRYMNIERENRSLEIGGTWYGTAYQRTWVNTESKYLLLRHAFEIFGCIRVQLKTDLRNERSQRAIERLGAQREGVLRDHVILPDGYIRSSVIYSILATEWPQVKAGLEAKLGLG